MKRLILLLAACVIVAAGCKGGGQGKGSGTDAPVGAIETANDTKTSALAAEDFTFDELFGIFSCFGDNIMSDKFAPQRVKDGIKDELRSSYEGAVEFTGPCNWLGHSLFDGDCYDGFEMACYRYKADGHVLVVLLENGGCDVSSVKYIRFYEYDPAQGGAHEVESPLTPGPERDDFEDMVRLAGADVKELRDAMQAGLYDYEFRPDGMKVRLNDPMDYDEQVTAMPASIRTASPASNSANRLRALISTMTRKNMKRNIRMAAICGSSAGTAWMACRSRWTAGKCIP